MRKFLLIGIILILISEISAQNTLSLTFKGQDQNGAYFQLDSVRVENVTQDWSETLLYPDTELILSISAGVEDYVLGRLVNVAPNPFSGTTKLSIQNLSEGPVLLTITDIQGQKCAEYQGYIKEGTNLFTVSLSTPQVYFFTIQKDDWVRSWKMVNLGHGSANRIEYAGYQEDEYVDGEYEKLLRNETDNIFVLGDEMRYTGYAIIDGEMRVSEVITQEQMEDDTIGLVFFQDAIPCSNMPTVMDHEGNVYGTLQVGTQCWTAESMRATTSPSTGTYLVNTTPSQYSYSGKIARWYNNDSTTYASLHYGLLYNWNAVVDTFNTGFEETGVSTSSEDAVNAVFSTSRRGICPEGWHVPSYAEWTELVNYVKSKEEYFCGNSPTKIAKAFASTTGWASNSGACTAGNEMVMNNSLGFNAYPSGFFGNGDFSSVGENSAFWTGSQNAVGIGSTWGLYYNNTGMYPSSNVNKANCYAVRCLRD